MKRSRTWLPVSVVLVSACAGTSAAVKRGPAPATTSTGDELDRVCAHSYEVLIAASGAGSPAVREDYLQSCREGAKQRRAELGDAAWATRRDCVLAGADASDLARCDGREPPVKAQAPAPAGDLESRRVCEHLLQIMAAEFGGNVFGAEEESRLIRGCIEDFDEAMREDPTKAEREARCVLQASSLQQLEACTDD